MLAKFVIIRFYYYCYMKCSPACEPLACEVERGYLPSILGLLVFILNWAGAALCAFALIFLCGTPLNGLSQVTGTVTGSRLAKDKPENYQAKRLPFVPYRPVVDYSYTVDGKAYARTDMPIIGRPLSMRDARTVLVDYAVGKPVRVFYYRATPYQGKLNLPPPLPKPYLFLICLFITVGGTVLSYVALKRYFAQASEFDIPLAWEFVSWRRATPAVSITRSVIVGDPRAPARK